MRSCAVQRLLLLAAKMGGESAYNASQFCACVFARNIYDHNFRSEIIQIICRANERLTGTCVCVFVYVLCIC